MLVTGTFTSQTIIDPTFRIDHRGHNCHMANEAPTTEATFKVSKRKRLRRKRSEVDSDDDEQHRSGLTSTFHGDGDGKDFEVGELQVVKRPIAKKYGISFVGTKKPQREEQEDMALVAVDQDGDQNMGHTGRFVRPTGRVAVVEDRHMYGIQSTKQDK